MARLVRRTVVLVALLPLLAAACGGDEEPAEEASPAAEEEASPEREPLRVALIEPGRQNDNSFNQAGAVGLQEAAEADAAVEFTILDETPDPTDSEPALRQFASQGFDLIIGHGIEYVEPIFAIAPEFPDVAFMSAAAAALGKEPTGNISDWLYDFPGMGYPLGVAAGLATQADVVGIVGGPELDFVKIMHAGFTQGVQSVNPDAEIVELFAGSFDDAQAAAEAAATEIQQGADVLYCSGDGICQGVAAEAQEAGVGLVTGFGDLHATAPGVQLTATLLDLAPLYTQFFELVRAGTWGGETFVSNLQNGQEMVIRIYTDVTVNLATPADEIQARIDEVIEQIQSGELTIEVGP